MINIKKYDLDKGYPNVLLIGNGLTIKNGISWEKLIEDTKRDNIDVSKYRDPNTTSFCVPNTVLTVATSIVDDQQRHAKYKKIAEGIRVNASSELTRLVKMPFDAILTTNYTYEIESVFDSKYVDYKAEKKRNFAVANRKNGKYLIHTYNSFGDVSPEIWHIHGELRRPSSLILSHDEYAHLMERIIEHNKIGYKYEKNRNDLEMDSWIDYFIKGNVFILGFGYDYAEFDMWWLLTRRLKEAEGSCGNIIFYEPQEEKNKYKIMALEDAGVCCKNLGFNRDSMNIPTDEFYKAFYIAAIEDIEKNIK